MINQINSAVNGIQKGFAQVDLDENEKQLHKRKKREQHNFTNEDITVLSVIKEIKKKESTKSIKNKEIVKRRRKKRSNKRNQFKFFKRFLEKEQFK